MKSMSKMNVNELRAYAVELGADEKRLYGTSKDSLKIIISNLKNEKKKEENTQENTEMLNKVMKVGNRWTKGNLDRVYINAETMTQLLDTEASNSVRIGNWFNRHERQNLKMFYDIAKDEIVVTAGDKEAKQELINALMELIMPGEETTGEETIKENKEDAKMENKKDMLNSMTVKELRAEAKAQGIKGMSKAKKDELVAALMSHNYGQPDPEEHTVEISKVRMYTFTGMYIGEFEAEVQDGKILVYTKRRGELMFDLSTGKELCEESKTRYANRVKAV